MSRRARRDRDESPCTPTPEAREAGPLAPCLASVFCIACLASVPYAMTIAGSALVGLGMIGAGSLVMARFLERKRWDRLVFWPLPIVLGVYVVSIFASGAPEASVRRSASMPFFSMLLLAVQVAGWRVACLRAVLWGCGLVAVAMSADITCQWLLGRSLIRGVPSPTIDLPGSQGNRNDMAAAALFMPLAFGAYREGARRWQHLLLATLTAPVWILSRSRQAAVGWTLGAVIPLVKSPGLRRHVIATLLASGVTATIVLSVPALRERAIDTVVRGLGVRQTIMAFGVRLFVEHPIVGVGPGTFGEHYATAARSGWSWWGRSLPPLGMPWVHSVPIEIAAEFGTLGMAGFLLVARHAWRGARMMAQGSDPNAGIGRGLVAALVAVLFIGLVDLSLIKDWFRIWFWMVLGLASLGSTRPEAEA